MTPFEDIYRDHHRAVARWLGWRFGEDIVDDAVQETFLQAWRLRDRIEGVGNIRPWLIGIAKRVAGHMIRTASALCRGGSVTDLEWSEQTDPRAEPPPQGAALYLEQLRSHFGCLGPTQREALTALADGETAQEFAQRTGRSQQGVSDAVRLGRRRLRERLGDDLPFVMA
jgi:RNA polymerase sigma-70 factor (ECF subfamily)